MDIDLGLFEGVEGADELLAQILGESAKAAETAEKVETTGSDNASAVSEEPALPRRPPVGTLFIDADEDRRCFSASLRRLLEGDKVT